MVEWVYNDCDVFKEQAAYTDSLAALFDFSDLEKMPEYTDEQWTMILGDLVPETDKDIGEYSFLYFMTAYLKSHLTNKFSPAHYELAEQLADDTPCKRLLWLFPREHAKTTIVTFAYVLWCICYKKKANIIITSSKRDQAQEFLRNIKQELQHNERINEDFGDLQGRKTPIDKNYVEGKWDEQHIITSNGVQVKLLSPGSQVRGFQFNQLTVTEDEYGNRKSSNKIVRPDLVILDDILDDKRVRNKQIRDELENWLFEAVFNAMDSDKGDLIIIGTILHFDDLLNRLHKDNEKTLGWFKRRTPACEIGQGGMPVNILWPDRWPAEKLLQRRQQIGSLAFSKEFLLKPREDEAVYFNTEWFRYYCDTSMSGAWQEWFFQNRNMEIVPPNMYVVTAIDPNISDKDGADYTVVMTVGFCPTNRNYYILDAYRGRPSPEQQVLEMIKQALRHGRQYRDDGRGYAHLGFAIETVAYQKSIRFWLKKYAVGHGIQDARYYEFAENIDKTVRISAVSPMVEQNRLYFPYGQRVNPVTGASITYQPLDWLESELNEFPLGGFDDGADALQRCYAVLVREERKVLKAGDFGAKALDDFDVMVKSYQQMDDYFALKPAA